MKEGVQKLADRALVLSLSVAIIGSALKILHLPGANYLLLVGLSSVSLAALIKYFAEQTPEGYMRGISIAFVCMAVLFRLMRWPHASTLFELAIISGIALLVTIAFFRKQGPE